MTIANDKQYRPLSIIETGYQNALTVRYYRDMNSNLANFKAKASNHKIVQENWSEGCEMESWVIGTLTFDADEEFLKMPYAPRYVPDGYSRLLVQSMHVRIAGSGETTWRLRVCRRFNNNMSKNNRFNHFGTLNTHSWVVFDPSHYPEVRTAEWTTNSDTVSLSSVIVTSDIRDRRTQLQLFLTSQNSDDTTISKLFSLDVTPLLGE